MKIMNKDFGNRLWGLSWGIYLVLFINYFFSGTPINILARILGNIILFYFLIFGVSRFTPDYRKIL